MRRVYLKFVAMAAIALLAGSACSAKPAARPAASPSPTVVREADWKPTPGACHTGWAVNMRMDQYQVHDCDQVHTYETVLVGTFTTGGATPPARESKEYRDAWAACDRALSSYLGGEWRERRMYVWL